MYCFKHEPTNYNVIMKVSEINKHYKLGRKINLFLTSLFKDYNCRSYIGSLRLQQEGVDTIMPIAYWTFRASWLNHKSYLLYQKVESDLTVHELCRLILQSKATDKTILIKMIANRCVDLVKKIHAANVRHDDPHGNNILTNLNRQNVTELNVKDIVRARFTLIDNDRCTLSYAANPMLKQFFDLRCLVRFNICEIPRQELLRLYLGEEYRTHWAHVLNFWDSGGFSINRRIKHVLK